MLIFSVLEIYFYSRKFESTSNHSTHVTTEEAKF